MPRPSLPIPSEAPPGVFPRSLDTLCPALSPGAWGQVGEGQSFRSWAGGAGGMGGLVLSASLGYLLLTSTLRGRGSCVAPAAPSLGRAQARHLLHPRREAEITEAQRRVGTRGRHGETQLFALGRAPPGVSLRLLR